MRPELHGHGAAMQNTLQAVSGAIGTAIMSTIMITQTNLFVTNEVTKTGQENPTSTQLIEITSDGLLHGINISFVTAMMFGVVGLVSMVVLAFALDKKKKELKTMLSNEGVY